jgi:hypothetical protein
MRAVIPFAIGFVLLLTLTTTCSFAFPSVSRYTYRSPGTSGK